MPDIDVEDLLKEILQQGKGQISDPALVDAVHRSADGISAQFLKASDRFDRVRIISAHILTAESPRLRELLVAYRDRYENRMLSWTVGDIHQAFARSPEHGWTSWITGLSAAIGFFRMEHALRLAEQTFPFTPSQQPVVATIRRGISCMRQSRWEEAYEQLEFLATQELPKATLARIVSLLAQIELWRFTRPLRAKALFERSLSDAPDDAQVLGCFGDYWLSESDFEKAEAFYRRAIERAPTEACGYVGMGDRFEKEEQFDVAEAWYRKATVSAAGDSLGYSRLLRLIGRVETLSARETEFLALIPQKIAADPESDCDTYLDVAQYYLNGKQYAAARQWTGKAVALHPSWPRAYTMLSDVCRAERRDDEAQEFCRRAIEADPASALGYLSLARIHDDLGQWSQALKVYQEAPQSPKYWGQFIRASIGRMYAMLENYGEAERILLAELRADPGQEHALRSAEITASNRYQKQGDRDAAKRLYDAILDICGDGYRDSYHNQIGNLHYYYDEFGPAVDEYRAAIEAAPADATYHRNLAGAYEQLKDYEQAEAEIDAAFAIDKNTEKQRTKKASLANTRGNEAFRAGQYKEAISHYTRAVELNESNAVYVVNLAGAYEHSNERNQREATLSQAVLWLERAQTMTGRQPHADRIRRLRGRIDLVRLCGESVLERLFVSTPIVVEVARNLIPFVEGPTPEALSPTLTADVAAMKARVKDDLGVRLPGIRFRGNETDLPDGAYIVMINEIPIVLGSVSASRRFATASVPDLASRGIVKSEPANDPTGRPGAWIDQKDWNKFPTDSPELWSVTQYIMRHVEAIVRRHVSEVVGHQEIMNILDTDAVRSKRIRASAQLQCDLTSVCRALLYEGLPIEPFGQLCDTFEKLRSTNVGLQEIVERIRGMRGFRERLQAVEHERTPVTLSPRFESELRRSVYAKNDRSILALEPELCQQALSAIRHGIGERPASLIVNDAALRPLVRRLVELEFPALPVLARGEVDAPPAIEAAAIDLEPRLPGGLGDFKSPTRADANTASPDRICTSRTLSDLSVTVFTDSEFAVAPSTSDSLPIDEMLSMMQAGLFYDLGILVPHVILEVDKTLKPGTFRIRLNGVDAGTFPGLGRGEFLVNDTADRMSLLNVSARKAVNPANGKEAAIVLDTDGEEEKCRKAGLTTWGSRGYLVLRLSAEIRRVAAEFLTDEAAQYALDMLGEAFPDLVRPAQERYTTAEIAKMLRELLDEGISIRDLRSILEALLSLNGTTDVDLSRFIVFTSYADNLCPSQTPSIKSLTTAQLADFVRSCLKGYLTYKYTLGRNSLIVFLLDPDIERRIAASREEPLSEAEIKKLHDAVSSELTSESEGAVILTTFEVRRPLRRLIEKAFPQLNVVSYLELSPDINIQPIARISWD